MLYGLLEYSSHPLFIAFGLILMSWVWEDASLVTGAILAADDQISVAIAVVAVFVGISSGDFALYAVGRCAHRWRKLRGWILTNPKSRTLSRRFRRRTFTNILIIRFIPGLRTLGFSLCGLWRVPYARFLLAMIVSGLLWIGIVFTLVYRLGTSDWFDDSLWRWSLIGVALLLLIANNVLSWRNSKSIRNGKLT